MTVKNPKLVVIDASAVLHRAWHALPKLTDPKGRIINAVYGFTVLLIKLLREQKPDYIAVALDTKAPTFRHKKYKEYKATRIPQPQEFYDQIPITKKVIQAFNIPVFCLDGFEADDLIATIINHLNPKISNLKSIVVTSDLDLLQLVDSKTEVYFLRHGLINIKNYNKDTVYQRFDLFPKQLIDFKSLCGDPSDNIKGVQGVGPKTAVDLIKKFKTIEQLYIRLEKCVNKKQVCKIKESLAKLLLDNKENVFLAKELITLKKDVKNLNLNQFSKIKKFDQEKIEKMFQSLGFKSLIKRLENIDLKQPRTKASLVQSRQNKLF